ncbi:MAG: tetratricopeptide repeat protein [Verrucomicrobiota bacterium]
MEAALRISGSGYSTAFFQKTADGANYTINDHFAQQFYSKTAAGGKMHPVSFPVAKGSNTVRIFILGESAAQGTPNPAFGFARILEWMLERRHPEIRFEVINAAMRGINSHIILPIARDCARHQPDLFLCYIGNNEVVGLHAPGPDSTWLNQNLCAIRLVQKLKSTRTGQLLSRTLERQPRISPAQDMAFFRERRLAFDDSKRARVYRFFEANLNEICEVTTRFGAKVLLSTIPVNLKDSPPFASLHRRDLTPEQNSKWERSYAKAVESQQAGQWETALNELQAAAEIDDHFADLHFRLGQVLMAKGDYEKARRHFVLARDRDALQFRADTPVNDVIRRVADQWSARHVQLFDAEQEFFTHEWSDHGIPGSRFFYEHVHLRFEGDYALARAWVAAVESALGERLSKPERNDGNDKLPSREECAARLAFTPWDEFQTELSMVQLSGKPPFLDQLDHAPRQKRAEQALVEKGERLRKDGMTATISIYESALKSHPTDWHLHHNFGLFWFTQGKYEHAAKFLEFEVKQFPHLPANRMALSAALARAGRRDEALGHLREALRLDPEFQPARDAIALIESGKLESPAPAPHPRAPAVR